MPLKYHISMNPLSLILKFEHSKIVSYRQVGHGGGEARHPESGRDRSGKEVLVVISKECFKIIAWKGLFPSKLKLRI